MTEQISVMIVDDEIINQEILAEYVEEADIIPYKCSNAEDAWEILKKSPDRFHALLLDIMLPQKSGLDLLKQIQQDEHLKKIPVIIQSSKGNRLEIEQGLDSGAFRYITKPYTQQQILDAIYEALERT